MGRESNYFINCTAVHMWESNLHSKVQYLINLFFLQFLVRKLIDFLTKDILQLYSQPKHSNKHKHFDNMDIGHHNIFMNNI